MFGKRQSKRLKKNLKSFKKKQVDISKYIKDFYLENGLAYISCSVRDYYDIIDRYSVEGYEWLKQDFAHFVETNAYYIPIEYPIVLDITGTKFTKKQQAVIIETISDYYALKLGDKQMDLDANSSKCRFLFVMGAAAFLLVWLLDYVLILGALRETIVILFWFFLWELGDLLFYDRKDLKENKVYAAQLASIKVRFSEEFLDEPDDIASREEILAEVFDEDVEEVASDIEEIEQEQDQ